jgi:hypothetical protein
MTEGSGRQVTHGRATGRRPGSGCSVARVQIVIDLSEARVHLGDPDDFGRFSVVVEGEGDLEGVVDLSGIGRLRPDGEHVVVDLVALRALAGPAATDEWDEGLAGMVAYAAGKGWMDSDGGVVAHIERRDEAG